MIMAAIQTIIAKWQLALGAVALLILALGLSYCEGRKDGRAIEQAKAAKLETARLQANAAQEAKNRQRTKDTDNAINQSRLAHAASIEQFIARGGVQPCAAGNQPKDRSAGSGEAVRAETELAPAERVPELVTVLPDDVRICSANTFLAEGLRDFVLGLEKQAGE
jgi:hypothetical protein